MVWERAVDWASLPFFRPRFLNRKLTLNCLGLARVERYCAKPLRADTCRQQQLTQRLPGTWNRTYRRSVVDCVAGETRRKEMER